MTRAQPPELTQSSSHIDGVPADVDATRTLYVTEELLVSTWRAFARGARLRVESTVRWAGPRILARASVQVATTVVVPKQRVSSGFFEISHEGTRRMGDALAEAELVNVAQIHTHPSRWVGHSGWDDTHAFSSRQGALSIIWPNYGRELPAIDAWGVHERTVDGWVELDADQAARRVVVLPSMLDLTGGAHELVIGGDETEDDDDRTSTSDRELAPDDLPASSKKRGWWSS